MAQTAAHNAYQRCAPGHSVARYYEAFAEVREHCAKSPRLSALGRARLLTGWTGIHSGLYALGCMRKPAEVHGRGQSPIWDEPLGEESVRKSQPPPQSGLAEDGADALEQENAG